MGIFKKKDYFYESFKELSLYAKKAMEIIATSLANFSSSNLLDLKNEVHQIEHEADVRKRVIEEKLAKEFVTIIDREDIFVLLDKIDDLTDAIDEIPYKMYMRNYKYLPPNIDIFTSKCLESINGIIEIFDNFSKVNEKKVMDPLIDHVLDIEEEVDHLYESHVHQLYLKETSYEVARLGERIYSYFEYVTDQCRDICKEVLIIMYKNI